MFSLFSQVGQTGFSSFHVISFLILSAQNKPHLSQKSFFFSFSPKFRRGKKSFVLSLSLCRSRQILGYICRPIKGSQLTPHVQVRLRCLPCNIHIFLFKQVSCLQNVVCEYIPLYYGFFFFHYVRFESFVLSSFENVIEPECDVIFAICAVFMAVIEKETVVPFYFFLYY